MKTLIIKIVLFFLSFELLQRICRAIKEGMFGTQILLTRLLNFL